MKIPKQHIVYAELLRCVHTIKYDQLPDWVCVFGIWDTRKAEYLPWKAVQSHCEEWALSTVPHIVTGHLEKNELTGFIPNPSLYGSTKAEGIVVWNYRQQIRGKIVRPEFMKQIDEDDHWTKYNSVHNSLRKSNETVQV